MLLAFTFATSSEKWGAGESQRGKYPVKLYNSSRVLIYQVDNGSDNSGKLPSGGMLSEWNATASSMNEAVAKPIMFYGGGSLIVVNQSGQSGDLYNYYWTSYSRGTDGDGRFLSYHYHILYLDSYIPLRHKSIYDPCPYGYRVPSNGTYSEFTIAGWVLNSYIGGTTWSQSWLTATGDRSPSLIYTGFYGFRRMSTPNGGNSALASGFYFDGSRFPQYSLAQSYGYSIRCIEDCDLLPDQTHSRKKTKRGFENTKPLKLQLI